MRGSLVIATTPVQDKKVREKTMVELETDKRRCDKWIVMMRKL
jgi:hypothetical protein